MKQWAEDYKEKIIPPKNLAAKVAQLKAQGLSIATLNGSFDLMHAGHLQIIYEASQTADVLLVALNTDKSIKGYKGPDRPIIPLEYRLQMMGALEFVSYLTWFDEADPRELLSIIQPDVHVNGAEYGADCIEADVVKSHGGKNHIVKLVAGLSTALILEKINARQTGRQ